MATTTGTKPTAKASAVANAANTEADSTTTAGWTFLTNHSHVLICLVQEPDLRVRDIAARVKITERAVQRIISELEEAGVLKRIRDGRRNRYEVDATQPLRHEVEAHCRVSDLLAIVQSCQKTG